MHLQLLPDVIDLWYRNLVNSLILDREAFPEFCMVTRSEPLFHPVQVLSSSIVLDLWHRMNHWLESPCGCTWDGVVLVSTTLTMTLTLTQYRPF